MCDVNGELRRSTQLYKVRLLDAYVWSFRSQAMELESFTVSHALQNYR